MRVLILHGWGGSDYPHWQAKLASKLACNYKRVYFPLLKNPHFPTLKSWLEQLKEIMEDFKPTVVVCHSLANNLWFWYASQNSVDIDRLYLVAIPSLNTKEETIKSFFPCPLPNNLGAKEVKIIASTNDIWCKIDEVKEISQKFGASLKILEDAGHINADSNYGNWSWIFNEFELKHSCED